jgi:hypothetical protein
MSEVIPFETFEALRQRRAESRFWEDVIRARERMPRRIDIDLGNYPSGTDYNKPPPSDR